MKTTGVSRRIDDLGRIVIPKEIRKNLKIRNGELLEIMVNDESIILSKHSNMKGIRDVAQLIVAAVGEVVEINMIVTDRDMIIATSPSLKKRYVNPNISAKYSEMMLKHQPTTSLTPNRIKINDEVEEETAYIIYPIVADGDVAGSVIALGLDNKITEIDGKMVEIVSKFLSRNI